ncbi:hypothetical protein [Agromyces sp. ZXT2-6]|uniref:hypothetical protein n=1 Tax=Agromyces sp. ZXT2-6 TaxID=3461153 RepID=UPI00405511C9
MTEVLHPAAIGLTAIAALLHTGWRRRAALPGLLAVLLMLGAMVDVVFLHRIGTVLWLAVLLAGAIGLSAVHAWRRRRAGEDAAELHVGATHDALGLVVMAALLPMMSGGLGEAGADAHAGHGAGVSGLSALVVAAALSHTVVSAVASVRGVRASERLMHLLMGGATLLMAGHALGQLS